MYHGHDTIHYGILQYCKQGNVMLFSMTPGGDMDV